MKRTRSLAAPAAVLALVLAFAACGKKADPKPAATAPVVLGPENLAVARDTTLASGPTISGALAAEREADVRAEVGGSVVSVSAEQGQRVAAGAVLARIDDTAVRDQYLSARAAVRTAQENLQVSRRNTERSERLAQAGAVSDRDLEATRASTTNATGMLADAQARLATAQKQLERTTIRAPFAGIVSERKVSAGDVVQSGGQLFTVIDPASMRLEASVPADQLGAAPGRLHRSSSASTASPTGASTAASSASIPRWTRRRGQVRIYVSIPNAEPSLVAGLFAEGRVATESKRARRGAGHGGGSARHGARSCSGSGRRRVERVPVQLGRAATRWPSWSRSPPGSRPGDTVLLGTAQGVTTGTAVRVPRKRSALMFISDFAIQRPIVTVTAMVALVVFGIFALLNLQTDEFPDIQQPVVGVTIVYPGRLARGGEREIVDPVEDADLRHQRGGRREVHLLRAPTAWPRAPSSSISRSRSSRPRRTSATPSRPSGPTCRPRWRSRSSPGSIPSRAARSSSLTLTVGDASPATTLTRLADPGVTRALRADSRRGAGERGRRHRAGDDGRAAARRRCRPPV